jgi:hypothetical protein
MADLWEEDVELELDFVDVSAGSKVLISTRVKALLSGSHEVEVGLPSARDSARMLLSAAGVDDVPNRQPAGVSDIVDLCGRLPLALGIAGRLAASLGLAETQDWSGMIGVLRDELRESHSGGTEEGIIRASLRGLKGSAKEQANVKNLLLLFALVSLATAVSCSYIIRGASGRDLSIAAMHRCRKTRTALSVSPATVVLFFRRTCSTIDRNTRTAL